jgi:hypothetical protein
MRFLLPAAAATIAMAIAADAPMTVQARPATDPIRVTQCFIIPPRPLSTRPKGTQIDFVNAGTKTATKIDFVVGYRNSTSHFLRHVSDIGDFEPGVLVQHSYKLYTDVTYAGKVVHGCQAISVHWADGSRWTAL